MSHADLVEINFDGLIGPSHNHAGLSRGNIASTLHAGDVSHPRAAALQGIAKMRVNLALGLNQGILLPHARPNHDWLARLGSRAEDADALLLARAMSASPMWAANAATVSPAPDTADGRCHLSVANLVTMAHRSHEWPETERQLRIAFADSRHFVVHGPVPPAFGDEGAANHLRLAPSPGERGIEIFVHGDPGGLFPARQHREAGAAIARRHGLDPDRTMFIRQSEAAIAAGAFHNDVVAVADGCVLFVHEQAFADRDAVYAELRQKLPGLEIVEVPAARISLEEAIRTYLFNAQLVTADDGGHVLIVPQEARDSPGAWGWLEEMLAGNGPIRRIHVVDLRGSMANGGGPACLRLRVTADPLTVDPRFLIDGDGLDRIAAVVARKWPVSLHPDELASPVLQSELAAARRAIFALLNIPIV